jgi:hypothetical protein
MRSVTRSWSAASRLFSAQSNPVVHSSGMQITWLPRRAASAIQASPFFRFASGSAAATSIWAIDTVMFMRRLLGLSERTFPIGDRTSGAG